VHICKSHYVLEYKDVCVTLRLLVKSLLSRITMNLDYSYSTGGGPRHVWHVSVCTLNKPYARIWLTVASYIVNCPICCYCFTGGDIFTFISHQSTVDYLTDLPITMVGELV
jgi:hypothetical protein